MTNQIASQANAGQSVTVTLNQSETASVLPTLIVGNKATISSSSNIGYIVEIDTHGTSFRVAPQYPFSAFQSDVVGYLKAGETVTIG